MTNRPLHGQVGVGSDIQARICVWKVEEDSVGNTLNNRTTVPATFELTTMLALGTCNGWACGTRGRPYNVHLR